MLLCSLLPQNYVKLISFCYLFSICHISLSRLQVDASAVKSVIRETFPNARQEWMSKPGKGQAISQ